MARNEEKLFGRLNRLVLQKQREVELEKHPVRPKLSTLNTAAAIKKWIPTISRDLDLHIKQLAVPCYPERVLDNINGQITALRAEYTSFVSKLRTLEPNYSPSEHRYQQRKRCAEEEMERVSCVKRSISDSDNSLINESTLVSKSSDAAQSSEHLSVRIPIAVLDNDTERQYTSEAEECPSVVWNCDPSTLDAPLDLQPRTSTAADECLTVKNADKGMAVNGLSSLFDAYGDADSDNDDDDDDGS